MLYIKYIIGFPILANIFFIASIYWLNLGRPIFNIDYLLLLVFCCLPKNLFSKILLLLIFFILFTIDILLLVLQIFPFVRLTDLIYLSGFIINGPVLYRVLIILTTFIFLVSFLTIRDYFLNKIKLNFKYYLVIILSSFMILFIKHLINPLEKNAVYAKLDREWIGSQVLFFIKNRQSSFVESIGGDITKLEPSKYEISTKPLFKQIEKNESLSKKILLVVNESWGETINLEHQIAILEPIFQKKSNLKFINKGSFNFVGATVAGELRELCGKQPTTFNLKNVNANQFTGCLPYQLKRLGYKTYAIHGAMSVMYDRSSWYPKAGFEQINFFEQLPDAGMCRSFSGRCDTQLIPHIKSKLLASDKSFVYWLTLNTHAPYDDKVTIRGLNCSTLKVKEGTETCNNYKLQYQFFSSLAQIINDPEMQGVEVYVVGDHSPPIFNLGDNFFSFKGSEVAWIHFKIRQ